MKLKTAQLPSLDDTINEKKTGSLDNVHANDTDANEALNSQTAHEECTQWKENTDIYWWERQILSICSKINPTIFRDTNHSNWKVWQVYFSSQNAKWNCFKKIFVVVVECSNLRSQYGKGNTINDYQVSRMLLDWCQLFGQNQHNCQRLLVRSYTDSQNMSGLWQNHMCWAPFWNILYLSYSILSHPTQFADNIHIWGVLTYLSVTYTNENRRKR